ncbi:MAG: transcriptional regulator [Candidatus Fluviicola riflensis]|nr:MAG: transcriptional regulator [Candidatus Fluviicola riflensis]OGS79901.1 MAG: transcriptional regulator [Candidatus Fluviicola riflensis]OGS82416.1 MAG: transcriptional regulator [Fluviicola sp. RIFCSPHIGHO2_01_FULL_43_53]OGS88080.1 MAG: transcriptional regulator [Fluviicola sp. RIFCSPHIGHO2_12_FULL_43_24]
MLSTQMIGNKIAEARKKMNVSQAQLAERLFISSQAVGKWERGESMPDIITLNRLAEILGVDLNYFSESPERPDAEFDASLLTEFSTEALSGKQQKKLNWDMSRGNWVDADFSGLKDLNEKFSSSNMQRCKFIGSNLSGLLLKNNNIDSCDFSGSDISKSHIQGSNFLNNKFNNCIMIETEFSGSHINGCDFTGADLTGMVFKSGGFEKNTVVNAVLNRTSFSAIYLADVVFSGTIEECSFENSAFKRVTFQNATLINTFFKNRSLKQLKFIDCKADRMTYEFLKNGKADLSGITLITA